MLKDPSPNHPQAMIRNLVQKCEDAVRIGVPRDEIKGRLLSEEIEMLMNQLAPQTFLEWVREDREYSYFYYEAQQSGVCAKPRELVAAILESMVLDALE
jgi:hypothetical protein